MFTKVLIADDLGSINQGVTMVLDTLGVKNVQQVQYCDDAFLKIKRAELDQEPFQLLITDLSFKPDHRNQTYTSGEDLAKAIKAKFPHIKVIMYSIEDRLQKVRGLMQMSQLDAYVCKGRRGLIELSQAITEVYNGDLYLSSEVRHALNSSNHLEIDDFDIELIKLLSNGMSQDQISQHLKKNHISPNSLSSIEKRINKLRIQFKASNAIHLVAITKDMGLI